jgi:hypothetical protein
MSASKVKNPSRYDEVIDKKVGSKMSVQEVRNFSNV